LDRIRISILVSGLIIIALFTYYTFSGSNTSLPKAGTKIEPVRKLILTARHNISSSHSRVDNSIISLKKIQPNYAPIHFHLVSLGGRINNNSPSDYGNFTKVSQNVTEQDNLSSLNIYENTDVPENYYSIGFPDSVTVLEGDKPGSFVATSGSYRYNTDLQDIPDDSNVQLYTLTGVEPGLKSSLSNYKLIGSGQLKIGTNRAWDLVYTWTNSTENLETMKVFVEGKDQAAVITFSSSPATFALNNSTFNSVLRSFLWLE
jgi:hypothetical protein